MSGGGQPQEDSGPEGSPSGVPRARRQSRRPSSSVNWKTPDRTVSIDSDGKPDAPAEYSTTRRKMSTRSAPRLSRMIAPEDAAQLGMDTKRPSAPRPRRASLTTREEVPEDELGMGDLLRADADGGAPGASTAHFHVERIPSRTESSSGLLRRGAAARPSTLKVDGERKSISHVPDLQKMRRAAHSLTVMLKHTRKMAARMKAGSDAWFQMNREYDFQRIEVLRQKSGRSSSELHADQKMTFDILTTASTTSLVQSVFFVFLLGAFIAGMVLIYDTGEHLCAKNFQKYGEKAAEKLGWPGFICVWMTAGCCSGTGTGLLSTITKIFSPKGFQMFPPFHSSVFPTLFVYTVS